MSESHGPCREQLVFADLVARLYSASVVPLWGSMVAGVLIAAAHWDSLDHRLLIGWTSLILVPTILRILLNRRYRQEAPSPEQAPLWARRSAFITLSAGLLWGLAGTVVAVDQDMVALVLTVTTIQALIMGGVLTLSPYLPSFFAYSLPAALPLIAALLSKGESGYLVLAVCNMLFLALLTSTAIANNRSLRRLLDLTYEKQELIQDLMLARRAAEQADEAKSSFLGIMSHELRTPITGQLAVADLLAGSDLGEEQRRWVGVLRASARTLLTVLNDILDFTKIEAGKLTIEQVAFAPRPLIEEALTPYQQRAAEKGLAFHTDLSGLDPGMLAGDPVRLRQILFNLLDNAVKFTERGGITVSAASAPAGRNVRLSVEVTDTGIGMSPEEVTDLFSPFAQADRTITRRYGGTGLGLAICRRLVTAMDGDIHVDSSPGVGTRFSFHLIAVPTDGPAEEETAPAADIGLPAAAAPSERQPGAGRPLKLLLAEDNAINRELVTTMLGRLGFTVHTAADGAEAVRAVQQESFDAVLMDIQMPVMDGIEACRAIRALEGPAARIPVIALSADVLEERRKAARAAGMDAYLGKPVDWPRLVHTVRRLCGSGVAPVAPVAPAEPGPAASVAHAAPELPVMNQTHLADLIATIGHGSAAELLREMVCSAREELAAVQSAMAAGDAATLRMHAHALKGLAANFGAVRLADAANALHTAPAAEWGIALVTLAEQVAATEAAVSGLEDGVSAG